MKLALLPRLGDTIFICILAACLLLGQRMLNLDSDLGRHLALGRYMLEYGQVPAQDILSFTRAGESRPPYEWLAQVALALAERIMGLDGVVLLTSGIIAAAFLVAFLDARERQGGPLMALAFTAWGAAAASLHWLTRPHVFTFLFFAVWLLLLDRLRRGDGRAVWQLPALMLAWANFHGGFVFGLIAWAAYALGWMVEHRQSASQPGSGSQLLVAGAASFAASLLTPGLGSNWIALLRNSSPYVLSKTAETLPVQFSAPGTWPFMALVVLGLLLCIRRGRGLVAAHVFLLLLTAALGLAIMRNIPLYCVASIPILADWARTSPGLNSRFGQLENRISAIDSSLKGYLWSPAVMLLAIAVLAGRAVQLQKGLYEFDPTRFPVAAVNWAIKNNLEGPAFNDLNWGGYLLFRLWPERRVFIDSQSDFYGEQFIREYAEMYQASGEWAEELARYRIAAVILPPTAPMAVSLLGDPNWIAAYEDSTTVVLVREEP